MRERTSCDAKCQTISFVRHFYGNCTRSINWKTVIVGFDWLKSISCQLQNQIFLSLSYTHSLSLSVSDMIDYFAPLAYKYIHTQTHTHRWIQSVIQTLERLEVCNMASTPKLTTPKDIKDAFRRLFSVYIESQPMMTRTNSSNPEMRPIKGMAKGRKDWRMEGR